MEHSEVAPPAAPLDSKAFARPDYSLFEQLPDGVLVVDRVGVIHYANRQASSMFGQSPEKLCGKLVETLLPAYLRSRHTAHRKSYANAQHMRPMGAGLELKGQRADGSTFPVDIMLNPIMGEAGGMVLAVVRDVTERRAELEALERSQTMFEQLFEQSPDAIVVTNAEGIVERVNAPAERLFACTRGEMTGVPVEQLMPERLRDQHSGHRGHYLRDPRARPMGAGLDLFGQRADGSEFPVDIMLSPLELRGRKLVLAVVRDVTERKREQERAEALMKEVNHRAKNMLGIVQALARQTLRGDPAEFLARFNARIAALAANQDLLIDGGWTSVEIGDLVRAQLGASADAPSVRLSGPRLHLLPSAVQPLGMALHELAANASRLGALSGKGGALTVTWTVAGDAPSRGDHLCISWIESCNIAAEVDASRSGYGTTVATSMLRLALEGDVELAVQPDGVRWDFRCRADTVMVGWNDRQTNPDR